MMASQSMREGGRGAPQRRGRAEEEEARRRGAEAIVGGREA